MAELTSSKTFGTTHWSIVRAAKQTGNTSDAAAAMELLCRAYWYPLYAFARGHGYSHQDAEDLTQGFFARVLSRQFLDQVGPEKGRFRSFLLVCLKNYMADEWNREHAAKRGGAAAKLPLDMQAAENRFQMEDQLQLSPDRMFERRWALDLLNRVLDRLRHEAESAGRLPVFERLQGNLLGEQPSVTYAQLGKRLGMSESAVKVAVHRMRNQYRELLREEIAQTVSGPEELEEELRFLRTAVAI